MNVNTPFGWLRACFFAAALWTATSTARADVPGTWPHALRKTAAIVEADVTGISYTYDDYRGPRTVATLKNMQCHRGALPAYDKLEVSTMGGRLPSGEMLTVTHVPQFVVGSRVLVFLTNGPWFLSPVYSNWSFRIMNHGGRKLIANEEGAVIRDVGPLAPEPGGQLATPDDLVSGTRNVQPAGVAAAMSGIDVQQFLDGIDTSARKYGVAVSGALAMNPTIPASGWNIVPEEPALPLCDEPLQSVEPKHAGKLVCDGGAP
jgi:hypothetical protein